MKGAADVDDPSPLFPEDYIQVAATAHREKLARWAKEMDDFYMSSANDDSSDADAIPDDAIVMTPSSTAQDFLDALELSHLAPHFAQFDVHTAEEIGLMKEADFIEMTLPLEDIGPLVSGVQRMYIESELD